MTIFCDLLIDNSVILTLDSKRRIFNNGAIAIKDGIIIDVNTTRRLGEKYSAKQHINADGGIVHPGFVEPHIHISQYHSRSAASVTQHPQSKIRYAEWKAQLFEEDEYASTMHGCLNLLRAGFTSYVDPGTVFTPEAAAAATHKVGMRAWLADPYVWDSGEVLDLYPALISENLMKRVPCTRARALNTLGGQLFRNKENPLIRGHIAIYGESTASDDLRQRAKECANANNVTFTEHLCFAPAIDQSLKQKLGISQVEHALSLGLLDKKTTAVHMNTLEPQDIDIIEKSGISIVWCVANYLAVAAGTGVRSHLPDLYHRGTSVALGIDSPHTTNPSDTAMLAYLAAKEAGSQLLWSQLLEMQTITAARTVGAETNIGSIEVGKHADIVVREASDLSRMKFDPVYELMLFERDNDVDTVIVDGNVVFSGGHSTRVDEAEVIETSRQSMQKIATRLGMSPQHGWPVIN